MFPEDLPNGAMLPEADEFSPLQVKILKFLLTHLHEWKTKADIEAAIKPEKGSSKLCFELANLVDRRYLERSSYGYRIRPKDTNSESPSPAKEEPPAS